MKKLLLAVLVLSLVVCCFALTVTANAATDPVARAAADTLDRGYIKYGNNYYTPTWNIDYTKLSPDTFWDQQFVWANDQSIVADYFGTGVSAFRAGASDTNNTQIGGLDNEHTWKKFSKNPVMTYVQFDVDVENLTMVNIWTPPGFPYAAVIFNGSDWHGEGLAGPDEFQSTKLAKGWRLSYTLDMSQENAANMEFRLNTTGTGAVYFANFIVAEIDTVCAPWVSSDTVTYDKNNPADVEINLDTKGKAITQITCDGQPLTAAQYTYSAATETLTLKAGAFDGKTEDVAIVVTTEGGNASFTVTAVEGKITISAEILTGAINKYFDNTTQVKEAIEIQLNGVSGEHQVGVDYTAEYDSAAVGTGKTITVHLTLTGADAVLYQLESDTLTIEGCEIYALIQVTPGYEGGTVTKYEDGTTTVAEGAFELTLNGVQPDDDVRATFTARFSAIVGEGLDIIVSNIVLTGKDAYKYALTQDSLTIPGKGEIIDRIAITISYEGDIEKRYDGTAFLNKNLLDMRLFVLNNVVEGDQVSITFDVAFIDAGVGDRTVQFTNITLIGRDAHKYKLNSNTYQKVGYILEVKDVAIEDDLGYYTMDGQTLQGFDFENMPIGSVGANSIAGLYLVPADGRTLTAEVTELSGNKVLKVVENCFDYATKMFSTNETGKYRDAGTYAVAFKVKPIGSKFITVEVHNTSANSVNGILADFRWTVTNNGDGKAISVSKDVGGWTGADQKYFNGKAEVDEDGWIDCYFEFNMPETTSFENDFYPQLIFFGGAQVSGQNTTFYFDDIRYISLNSANKYMTIDHNYDFNDGVDGEAVTNSPFYSPLNDGFVYDNSWSYLENDTVIRLDVPAHTTSEQAVGALRNGTADGNNKLFMGRGIHYVQFDFDMTGCSSFKLYSQGTNGQFNFFAITITGNPEHYAYDIECYDGWITNFKMQVVESGMTRISFVADMTGSAYDATYMNLEAVTNDVEGSLFFDNLFVSHEDYTPLAKDTTYNLVAGDNEKVSFDVDLKGARLLGLQLNGQEVSLANYSYTYGGSVILVDRSLFDATEGTHTLTIITSEGDISAQATLNDNRQEVTLSLNYTGEAITKAYDGTTDVEKEIADAIVAQIEMIGVEAGDQEDVDFTYDIAFSQKDAGAVEVVISNIALTGDKAEGYKLGTETLSVPATITKIQLTVSASATVASKTYDGTTTANVTAGNLVGVIGNEEVNLVATGVFNSKNVKDATTVTVTYSITGADAGNYLAPVSENISATIGKKTITVTADNKSMVVGENDPALTYQAPGLVAGDTLTGALTREEGTAAGQYSILQGTLTDESGNYTINFVEGKLTITEKPAEQPGTEPGDDDEGLSGGAIAGIAVGSTAVAGGGAALAVVLIRRRRRL